jgi:hypothetical protein
MESVTLYRVHRRVQNDDGGWHIVVRKDDAAESAPELELEAGDLQLHTPSGPIGDEFRIGRAVAVQVRLVD